ncbi:MAG: NAD(P)/FAD-dependent oxidoreductase, partial [Bacteroidota bacterium]
MVQSYKKNYKVEKHYDTIIIGSGMGGLATAAILAKEGQKVLVLERHYTAGGFTHIFKRKGYEWDVGIHYIGDVERSNSSIKKMFDYVTDGELKWADMGEVYDRIIIGERSYDFVKGVTPFKEKLISYFPEEAKAIEQYIDLVFEVNKSMRQYYLDKTLPSIASKMLGGFMRKSFLKYSDQTTDQVLRSLTQNEELIKVLTGQYGDYGLPPKQSSFVMHASVVKHYFQGGYFPVGGSSQIVKTIDPIIEAASGTILISAEVQEIIVEKNKAKGVRMKDGQVFYADAVVSGAGIFNTYQRLLPQTVSQQHQLDEQLQQIHPSASQACLYIGLKGSPEELQLPKTNFWIYPDDLDHDACIARYLEDIDQPFPVVYISFPAAK